MLLADEKFGEKSLFGKINYSEFLAATISMQAALTDEKLWSLFKTFDTDDTDYISLDNLLEAFQRLGRDYSEEEVKKMLQQHEMLGCTAPLSKH